MTSDVIGVDDNLWQASLGHLAGRGAAGPSVAPGGTAWRKGSPGQ